MKEAKTGQQDGGGELRGKWSTVRTETVAKDNYHFKDVEA